MRRKLRKTGSGVGAGDVEIVRVEAAEAAAGAAVGEAGSGRAATGSARRRAVATGISRGEGPATSARWSVRGWMRREERDRREPGQIGFLITITGGEPNMHPLTREEHYRVTKEMEDEIF